MKCNYCVFNVKNCTCFKENIPKQLKTLDGCSLHYNQAKKLHSLINNEEEYKKYLKDVIVYKEFYERKVK